MDNFGLPDKTIEMIKNLFYSYSEISEVKIFGSRAKGNYKSGSDIDLAIFGNVDEKLLRHIAFELDELSTPYKFDVLNYNTIDNEALKQNVDKCGKLLYKNYAKEKTNKKS